MKLQIWDILAIVLLLATLAVGVVIFQIYADPYGSLNPFPPPTLPSMLVLPTYTKTPLRLPATWTATLAAGETRGSFAPSTTPLPTSTGFVLPSYTPTATNTPTPTNTRTVTRTPTRTPVTPTKTPNLTQTYSVILTKIMLEQTSTAAVKTANAVATSIAQTKTAAPPPPN